MYHNYNDMKCSTNTFSELIFRNRYLDCDLLNILNRHSSNIPIHIHIIHHSFTYYKFSNKSNILDCYLNCMFNIKDGTISGIRTLFHHIFYRKYPYISNRFYWFNPHNTHLKDIQSHRINILADKKKNFCCMINIGYSKLHHKSNKRDDKTNKNFNMDLI